MKYIILCSDYTDELSRLVNEFITEGWQPLGGVAFDKINRTCQAMVKPAGPTEIKIATRKERSKHE